MGINFLYKPLVGLGILFCLSALISLLVLSQFRQAAQARQMVVHTYQVLNHIEKLSTRISEAESAQRGYVMTGHDSFRKTFQSSGIQDPNASTMLSEFETLQGLTKDNPHQQKRIVLLKGALDKKIEYMDYVVELVHTDKFASMRSALTQKNRGVVLMDELNVIIKDIEKEERDLLNARTTQYDANNSTLIFFILTLIGTLTATMGVSIYSAHKEFKRRRATEDTLRESGNFQKAILDGSYSAIIVTDVEGTITLFNPAAEKMLGYLASEVVGMHNPGLFHVQKEIEDRAAELSEITSDRIGLIDVFSYIPLKQGSEDREWTYVNRKGHHFPVQLCVTPLFDKIGNVKGFMGMANDITERRQIEKMKNEFISTVSHELRTPLTSIRGSLGLIAGNVAGELPEKAKSLVAIAHKNSERLVRLINNILDVEKIESGHIVFERKPVSIDALVEQAVQEASTLAIESRLHVNLANACPKSVVIGDFDRLLQVLTNLLSNAVKFSPKNSVIELRVNCVDGNQVEIGVHDTGAGVPLEFQSRIFGKFAQADSHEVRQSGGSGLGLNISRSIAESMNGTIDFRSEPGNTYFFVRLPIASIGNDISASLSEIDPSGHVLVCAEDQDISALLEMILQREGYNCTRVKGTKEARQSLATHEFAAVIMDMNLPDGDAFNLLKDMREKEATAKLPIIAISGHPHEDKSFDGSAIGIVDWLTKPIDAERLRKALLGISGVKQRPVVLHIEDDEDITYFLASAMEDVKIVPATTLAAARILLEAQHFDLAVLDIYMPDGSGLDLLPELGNKRIPVVILSVDETSHDIQRHVCASLVKTVVSENKVVETIKAFIGRKNA